MSKVEIGEPSIAEQIKLSFKAGQEVEKEIIEVLNDKENKMSGMISFRLLERGVTNQDRKDIGKISLNPADIAYTLGAADVFAKDIFHKASSVLAEKTKSLLKKTPNDK